MKPTPCVREVLIDHEGYLRIIVAEHSRGVLDVEDAMQEARVALWAAMKEWDGRVDLTSYIGMKVRWTTQEHARKVIRRRRAAPMLSLDEVSETASDDPSQEERLFSKEAWAFLAESLPSREGALLLRTMGDETLDEVAGSIGISKSWGSRLRDAAVARGRALLEDGGEVPCS